MGSFTGNAMAPASGLDPVVATEDLRFVADLSRRMQWDAQQATDPDADFVREHIAAGTLSALVWLLDVTDVAPATGRILLDRSPAALDAERSAAQRRRALKQRDGAPWLELGGVLDALDFAAGVRDRFWWVPLPEPLRAGPMPRDEFGRSS